MREGVHFVVRSSLMIHDDSLPTEGGTPRRGENPKEKKLISSKAATCLVFNEECGRDWE